jgi:TPR repeat protein
VQQAIVMLYPQLRLFAGSAASAVLSVAFPNGTRAAAHAMRARPGVLVDALEGGDPDATWAYAKMCALAAATLPGSKCSGPLHAAGIVFYVPKRTFKYLENQAKEGATPACSVALFLTRFATLLGTGGDVDAAARVKKRPPAEWAFDVLTALDQQP